MADASIHTLNIKDKRITWGPVDFDNLADDAISIEVPGDDFEVVRSCDGIVTHVAKNIADLKITINLKQTSQCNDQLSALALADRITGASIFPFMVAGGGTSITIAPAARIIKRPNADDGNTAKDRSWVFGTGPAAHFIGGN